MRTRPSSTIAVKSILVIALIGLLWTACTDTPDRLTAPNGQTRLEAISASMPLDAENPQVQAVIAVQEQHTPQLMKLADVIGTGTGLTEDGRLAILVLTRSRARVADVPAMIEGVPTRVQVVGEVRPLAFKGTYRPVPGGVSVGNDRECAAGSIGCIVLRGSTRYVLSNNHVLARVNAASIGERIDQPGRYDGSPRCAQTGQIGTLTDFVSINFSPNASNVVDAAIAQLSQSSVCSMVNNLYTPSSTVTAPSVGLAVKKTGRTSGLTHGTIAGINVTINVNYGSPGVARFVNQIYVASNFIRSGDSGSMMVTESGNNPVGLNFAGGSGSSFANPMGPVLQGVSATICGQ